MKQIRHSITGYVVDENCRPLDNVIISIVESSVLIPETAQHTGPDGRFRLTLPVGVFTIRAISDLGEHKQISVKIPCPEPLLMLVLKSHGST